jgi:DNA-binding FadR family transcriptional regulator
MEFHLKLARLSGNQIRINTLKYLFDLLYLKYRGNILFVTPMDRVDNEHIQLYEAIENKDLPTARKVLSSHIANVKQHAIESTRRALQDKRIKPM